MAIYVSTRSGIVKIVPASTSSKLSEDFPGTGRFFIPYLYGGEFYVSGERTIISGRANVLPGIPYISGTGLETTGIATTSKFKNTVFLRPNSDSIDGSWIPSTGTDLYSCIDETTYSDVDYISSTGKSTFSSATLILNSVIDSGDNSNHYLRVRIKGDNATILRISLLCDSTVIASRDVLSPKTNYATYEYLLTTDEVSNITDYSNLKVKFDKV
jgi:hypothetical protein